MNTQPLPAPHQLAGGGARLLHSWGWVSWDAAVAQLGRAQACWLEPDGLKYGPVPQTMPLTARLHAWDDRHLWRLIPDSNLDRVLLTALADGPGESQDSAAAPGTVETGVEGTDFLVQEVVVTAWTADFVGPLPPGMPTRWRRYDVVSHSTIGFLHADTEAATTGS